MVIARLRTGSLLVSAPTLPCLRCVSHFLACRNAAVIVRVVVVVVVVVVVHQKLSFPGCEVLCVQGKAWEMRFDQMWSTAVSVQRTLQSQRILLVVIGCWLTVGSSPHE